ncbi:AzlD domain-containing protein [Furfurilactobacillus siliginis]|uniref:Branched-chain amino acid ABC transporter n=1 Tax=Furfurilactobacillus siliginis TaxID=348151 RepID=A0A510VQQ9_9LACO|nr:AzlD domain-containing protein [Furfurilactobacillus siliginis]GEK29284.1 branched-chain amino acid ABC transporter [Furfurilactobacillus siliginis]
MLETSYVLLTIVGCAVVTWLSRVLPFALLKRHQLPPLMVELLSFVPITIMTALWINSLFSQHVGHLPTPNVANILASVPTVIVAFLTKQLLWIVIAGMISLAVIRAFIG